MENTEDINKFLSTPDADKKDLLEFAFGHKELKNEILYEVKNQLKNSKKLVSFANENNPFAQEKMFLEKLACLKEEDLPGRINIIKEELLKTKTGRENSADFNFYKTKAEKIVTKKTAEKENQIIGRNLLKDLEKSFLERYNAWCLEQIEKERKKYLKELFERIAKFKKLEELLKPFLGQVGRLWDMSAGAFDVYGFDILKTFADLLEKDKALTELAELLGRQKTESDRYEKELRDKVEVKVEFVPKPAYKGQINGLTLGSEISSALPEELALYKNKATKKYFMLKMAEKKLLSYSYMNQTARTRKENVKEEVQVEVKEKKGPVIICVDTSGSMQGAPEQVAKTITFALAKKCISQNRKCYLISFSTGIEVQDLSELKGADAITGLVAFLRKSFNGGTDAAPALEESLLLLKQNEWKNADVLMVSDFVMGSLGSEIEKNIKEQQKEKTKFYSLVIGNSGNEQTIKSFDENWAYNPCSKDAMHHLVRQLRKINNKSVNFY